MELPKELKAKSQQMETHVASGLVPNHGEHDHRPALHGRDDDHESVIHGPNVLCRGIHRNTSGMNTRLLQIRSPLLRSMQNQNQLNQQSQKKI